ncbi:MAG: spore maturation protein [Melioribacteraceae bacterium]|nr:spore maturation protein [Melioribacteraceae bacterium]
MLNYVWMGLILLGISLALITDFVDKGENKYRNGEQLPVEIIFNEKFNSNIDKSYQTQLQVTSKQFNQFYDQNIKNDFIQPAQVTVDSKKNQILLYLKTSETTPGFWKEMAGITGKENDLTGTVNISGMKDSLTARGSVILESVSFSKMKAVTNSALDYAGTAVEIALGLIGIMALWLGIMKVAEEAGLIKKLAKAVRPLTRFLFPDVPPDHPAIGSMIMNMSANMLGLGNAATPFGLKAMEELESLNKHKGTATNAMCTFLAVNTAGLTMIPATAIAIRSAAGSSDPAIIIGTSAFGAICATTVGLTASKVLEKFTAVDGTKSTLGKSFFKGLGIVVLIAALVAVLTVTGVLSSIFSTVSFIDAELFKSIIQVISTLAIPLIMFTFITFGVIKKVKIYEVFVEGAKEGFNVAIRIIPYLVAMLVAIGVFRAGGGMDFLIIILKPMTQLIGMPAEALPMALMRPLSGSGSLGIMAEIIATHGADSTIGIMVSTFFGSTETTFYVLAVYFGAANIKRSRHALVAGLLADAAGIIAAVFIVNLLFG